MVIFLIIFLLLYGGLNFYLFFKLKYILNLSGKTEITIIILLILLTLAPIIIRLLEKVNLDTLARQIAYWGYLWMAFIFLFFFLNITFDITRYGLKLIFENLGIPQTRNIFFGLAVFLSFSFVIYGFFDAQKLRVKKLEIYTSKLAPNTQRIRIVQLSDVHIGLIIRGKRLEKILQTVKKEKPDILVSTGDLLDGELDNVMLEAEQFKAIKTQYGKYAIPGNHEYYAGIEKALEFTKKAGFEILRDESKKIAGINIIGLEDPTARRMRLAAKSVSSLNLFPQKESNEFVLLLKHQPTIKEDLNFDLQLSGHTHGGQIFPFMFFTRIFFPENFGYHTLSGSKSFYISKGAGTWGPPVRLLASPEITVIDLIKQ